VRHRDIGSLWGKWDLHFHTPSSFDYENKQVTDAQIIGALTKEGIEVVAITDHHFIDVSRVKSLQSLAKDDLTVLPGIEFRTELGGKEKVHLIGIFPEDCNLSDVWTKLCGKLELTPEDIKKRGGHEKIYVDFKKAAETIRDCGGFISVHAGGKSNSIEGIGNNEKFKMALKTDLARDYIDIFEVGKQSDCEAYEKIVFPAIGFSLPLVLCSDNHDITQYAVAMPCWVKGDPCFRTFQQLKSEPRRAWIGPTPPEVERMDGNKTKYISMIEFKKLRESKLDEDWFSGSVPINPGLIAIIGNKGSGKTALAEIIGLLGNCELEREFSFLNDQKFRQRRNNKAAEFRARITWRSGHQAARTLSDSTDESQPRAISYIPQNYLEKICNEVSNLSGSQFDQELKSVIFSHVAEDQKLNASSLDELLEFKNEPIMARINDLRSELHEINSQIVGLKEQASDQQKQLLLNLTASKERELESHDKSKPVEFPKPGTDPSKQAELDRISKQIESKNSECTRLTQAIRDSEALKKTASTQIACAARINQTVTNFQASHRSLIEALRADCQVLGIDPISLVTVFIDLASVSATAAAATEASKEQDGAIAASKASIESLKKEIQDLSEKLDAPNNAYQRYLQALAGWKERREEITGNADTPETVEYFKRKVAELDTIPEQLKAAERSRGEKVEEIYNQISAVVENYKRLYQPVQEFISSHPLASEKFRLDFNASIVASDLESTFLGKINRGRKGSFNGIGEGNTALSRLVATADFQSAAGANNFAQELLNRLEYDHRVSPKTNSILKEQLVTGVEPIDILDTIFGLEYLVPRYQLRWSGKDLDELSPGERGTLLLVFYLLIDRRDSPLVIDQPEENLDNQTVYEVLVPCLREARRKRQVIIVTHNPNLAIVCDADQVIHAQIDKQARNKVTYTSGAIENSTMNRFSIAVLEGTRPAFDKRDSKYQP